MHETDNLMKSAIVTLKRELQNNAFRPKGENIIYKAHSVSEKLTESEAQHDRQRPCI